jgi:glycosyltransferase involved in cell wall biosynthesis
MKLILIIPAYNEEKNILDVTNSLKEMNLDFVVINDGSTDNTEQICKDNNINHVTLVSNLGIGGAVQTGYKYAYANNYDIAIQFDGDGQHDASYIGSLCENLENNKCDFCIGSRYIDNISGFRSTKMRRVGKSIISFLIKMFTGKKITDPTSGYRAANRKVISIFAKDYPIDYPEPESIIDLFKRSIRVQEIPVAMHERKGGKSSITIFKSAYYMIRVCLAVIIYSLRYTKKEESNDTNIKN